MASSVIYDSTHAWQNEIYLFYTSKVLKNDIRDLYSNSEHTRTNEIASFILIVIYIKGSPLTARSKV